MSSRFFFVIISFLTVFTPFGICAEGDTLTISGGQFDEIEVTGNIVQPTANNSHISDAQLNESNTGQNLPYLLSSTPSLIVMSDDGLGVGYSYFRIRGTDQSRINMTINDVPLNDQESQTVFWVKIGRAHV